MKKDFFIQCFIFSAIMFNMIACNTGNKNSSQNDTGKTSSGVDSMPIVKPPVNDSAGTIITPRVNDSNAVIPDTNGKSK